MSNFPEELDKQLVTHNGLSNYRSAESTLAVLEEIYMNGCADEVSGDVDAPSGHFYRVGRYIVFTDSQGFRNLFSYATTDLAKQDFEYYDREYARWCDT